MYKIFSKFGFICCVYIGIFLIIGCPKKIKPPEIIEQPVEEQPVETSTAPVEEVEELPIRGKEFINIPELKIIHFDYDKTEITPENEKILQSNANFLSSHNEYEILVEGHCCECGTNEYNLALGQKRAEKVRQYYIKLGIEPSRIGTISFGEEKPVNKNAGPPDSPLCRDNRRVETKVRVK